MPTAGFQNSPGERKCGKISTYPGRGRVPVEYGPGLPVDVVSVLLVHVLTQPVDVGAGQFDGELQELLRVHQGADGGVEPGGTMKGDMELFMLGVGRVSTVTPPKTRAVI